MTNGLMGLLVLGLCLLALSVSMLLKSSYIETMEKHKDLKIEKHGLGDKNGRER